MPPAGGGGRAQLVWGESSFHRCSRRADAPRIWSAAASWTSAHRGRDNAPPMPKVVVEYKLTTS
eukprot:scaffold296889_cov26-Tisochrysis_lutea.AAC.6